jgi:hypothetical protein
MKYTIALLLGLTVWFPAHAEPVREIEITSIPPDNGQQLFTVRFTPNETLLYDKVTFECVLRQEFAEETTHQNKGTKIHEPANFTYTRKDVKMVEDLDNFISFRIPVSHPRLQDIFGPTAFNTNHPVTVARMTISASGKQATWSCEIPASGISRPPFPTKAIPVPKSFRP